MVETLCSNLVAGAMKDQKVAWPSGFSFALALAPRPAVPRLGEWRWRSKALHNMLYCDMIICNLEAAVP